MRTQVVKRGFTLIELLVVIAIIGILAAIVFPIFARAQEKARSTQCLSNVRQLALATLMFVQDSKSYPDGSTWTSDIEEYAGNRKIFTCPQDPNGAGYVSYGISPLVIDAKGEGIKAANVTNPTEVGLFSDADSYKFPEAGILFGGNTGENGLGHIAEIQNRHGVNIAFCDGHVESVGKKDVNMDNMDNRIYQAFYSPIGYDYVLNNEGAGVTPPATATCDAIIGGGSTTCEPLVKAAVELWSVNNSAENGVYSGSKTASATTAENICGRSSSDAAAATAGTQATIARDAMVIIVNKNCKIGLVSGFTRSSVNSAALQAMYATTGWTATCHPYTRTPNEAEGVVSGTFEMFLSKCLGNPSISAAKSAYVANPTSTTLAALQTASTIHATIFENGGFKGNKDVVSAVAKDVYGIAYTSAGVADPSRVTVLKFGTQSYSRQNVLDGKYTELVRPIYVTWSPTGTLTPFTDFMVSTAFQKSPLMNSLFFKP